jgi:hypothetical protein
VSVCRECKYYRKYYPIVGIGKKTRQCGYPDNTCYTGCGKKPHVFLYTPRQLNIDGRCSWYKSSIKTRLKSKTLYYLARAWRLRP